MPPTIRPADRELEPQHLKLLNLIAAGDSEEGEGTPVHQNQLEQGMKPNPYMFPIEQMVDYGLIENPDPTMKRHWILTRRGEQVLALENRKREKQRASEGKPAAAPPAKPAAPKTNKPKAPKPTTPARSPESTIEA